MMSPFVSFPFQTGWNPLKYVATGWFANADYSNADDVPYVIGYKFACTEGGEYSIDSLLVKTGIYEG